LKEKSRNSKKVGVTGSVAAIKLEQLLGEFGREEFELKVIATEKALHFMKRLKKSFELPMRRKIAVPRRRARLFFCKKNLVFEYFSTNLVFNNFILIL